MITLLQQWLHCYSNDLVCSNLVALMSTGKRLLPDVTYCYPARDALIHIHITTGLALLLPQLPP